MTGAGWPIERHRGSAAAFHGRTVPEPVERALWCFEVDRPAIVLGSTQRDDVVDAGAARAVGMEVARRRSGGGAVLLEPGGTIWIDVLLPSSDPRWEHDVGRSFGWLGRAWSEVLAALGVAGAVVHDGPLVHGLWSDLVCFAGLGPGEVTVDGQKVVGISQRRTRAGARFQCALLLRWSPELLVGVLALSPDQRAEAAADLAEVARGIGPVGVDAVVELVRRAVSASD